MFKGMWSFHYEMFPKDKWKLRSVNWFSNYPEFKNLIQHQLSIRAVISSKYGLLLCLCVCNSSFSGT